MADNDAGDTDTAKLQIGSGDFQNNPIHGDYDMRPSYAEFGAEPASPPQYDQTLSSGSQYDGSMQSQQYHPNTIPNQNTPHQFNQNTPHQFNQNTPQQFNQNTQQFNRNVSHSPQLPYSQSLPPQSHTQPPIRPPHSHTFGTQIPEDEPDDVVAQMNTEEDINYTDVANIPQPHVDDSDSYSNNQNGYGLFGNFLVRTMYISLSIFVCALLSFSMWFQKISIKSFSTAFGLSGFAVLLLFLSSLMAFIWALLTKLSRPIPMEKVFLWSIIILYIIGGLCYFIGGCAVAYAWNSVDASSIAGIFFAEQTFVAIHAILAGVDLWKRNILNDKKRRVIIYNGVFILLCVVDFFAYAVTSTKFDEAGADNAGPAWLALFYFILLFPDVVYLIVFLCPSLNDKFGKPIVYVILGLWYLVCAVCVLIGYFIVIGNFEGVIQGRAYFLAFGLFVMLCATVNAFDMVFDRFVPGYKDGGMSVADQGINGSSAVATRDPDSPSAEHFR